MTGITEISSRKAYPVIIGTMTMYCENFRISGNKLFSEKSTASGKDVFTNTCLRALKFTLEGRIYNKDSPLGIISDSDSIMRNNKELTIEYRGMYFPRSFLQSFSIEDKDEDFICASLTFITSNAPIRRETNAE